MVTLSFPGVSPQKRNGAPLCRTVSPQNSATVEVDEGQTKEVFEDLNKLFQGFQGFSQERNPRVFFRGFSRGFSLVLGKKW